MNLIKLKKLNFNGNERFNDNELLEIYDTFNSRYFNKANIDKFIDELKELYLSFGFNKIKIEYEVENIISNDENYLFINFLINEGKISKIKKVSFIGNNNYNYDNLIDQIKSKPRNNIFFFTNRNFKKLYC